MAHVQYFKFDSTNIDVIYDIECDDGNKFTEKSTVTLKADTYGLTRFIQKHATFDSLDACSQGAKECVGSIDGRKALTPADIEKEFENCFQRIGKVDSRKSFNGTIQARKDTGGSSAGNGNQANPLLLKYAFVFVVLMISMFIWINWTHNTVFFVNSRLI